MVFLVMIMAEKPPPQSAISFVGSNLTVNREQKGGIGGRVFCDTNTDVPATDVNSNQEQATIKDASFVHNTQVVTQSC